MHEGEGIPQQLIKSLMMQLIVVFVICQSKACVPYSLIERKMRLFIADNNLEVGEYTAEYVVKRIASFNPTSDKPFVLGLPTGIS
jgi:hypothetical protein